MILELIDSIRGIVREINPGYVFECDAPAMMNIKMDTVERNADGDCNDVSNSFVYVEEPTSGYYDIPPVGFQKQRVSLRIYFGKFEPMHNDAYKGDTEFSSNSRTRARLEIKEQIEEEMVRPFLYLLKSSDMGKRYPSMLSSVRVTYPPAQFDANEVTVCLEITAEDGWCIDTYKPKCHE